MYRTLPAGTRTKMGSVSTSALELRTQGEWSAYWGRWHSDRWREMCATAEDIDWSSVPLPAAAPPECGAVDDGPELDCHCGHSGCSRCDTAPPAPVLCATPACAARSVVATHGSRCVYCDHSMGCRDGHQLFTSAQATDQWRAGNQSARDEAIGATRSLAAMDRAERPRGNPAEARELSKPHPWEEFE